MDKWKKYYKLPLNLDPIPYCSYAWTFDNEMALTFSDEIKRHYAEIIIKGINGDLNAEIPNIRFDGVDFFDGNNYIFCVRGWGSLTGIGGHNLPQNKAEKIQDSFINYIFNQLKPTSNTNEETN